MTVHFAREIQGLTRTKEEGEFTHTKKKMKEAEFYEKTPQMLNESWPSIMMTRLLPANG